MKYKPYYLMGLIILVVVGLPLLLSLAPGKADFILDDSSAIKDGVVVKFSTDDYQEPFTLPISRTFRPGKYTVVASAANAQTSVQDFRISAFSTAVVKIILLPKLVSETSDETNPDPAVLQQIPYYQYFPYDGGDYTIAAEVDLTAKKIRKLVLTVFHRFAGPDTPDIYAEERAVAVDDAKKHLGEFGVPADIPIEVLDK
ncbi:MAG: hypothetical protein NUV80_04900 [Candidatus Berkelbacteria bacterium]|nr:hypothetical protein [Candidatus Berkelbacteria bacterium]MCR4307878.1 hypothetical protein [Candidatus Berkelbacteria bacterium]